MRKVREGLGAIACNVYDLYVDIYTAGSSFPSNRFLADRGGSVMLSVGNQFVNDASGA